MINDVTSIPTPHNTTPMTPPPLPLKKTTNEAEAFGGTSSQRLSTPCVANRSIDKQTVNVTSTLVRGKRFF
jgi:hypothetical protein